MNNTPTLMQSEEKTAPWTRNIKTIEVNISQCLSTTVDIEVPEDFDVNNIEALEKIVIEEIVLPSDCLEISGHYNWVEDDFCVSL